MARKSVQRAGGSPVWGLAAGQHGVVARHQLMALGLTPAAIEHRLAIGRLHRVMRGVYAVGRPELTQSGRWMAAVLSCGPGRAALSHESAGAAYGIRPRRGGPIEVSVVATARPRSPGLRVHRRACLRPEDIVIVDRVPVTSPVLTIVDLATRLSAREVDVTIDEADKRDLVDPETLRRQLALLPRHPGRGLLRRRLDRHTFAVTDSALERRFLELARAAGLPPPLTGRRVSGFKVDFYWPVLGLVVETDGLRYHRTPAQQARDRLRDQAHIATGLTPLRFTYAQVRYGPDHVLRTLKRVAERLA